MTRGIAKLGTETSVIEIFIEGRESETPSVKSLKAGDYLSLFYLKNKVAIRSKRGIEILVNLRDSTEESRIGRMVVRIAAEMGIMIEEKGFRYIKGRPSFSVKK